MISAELLFHCCADRSLGLAPVPAEGSPPQGGDGRSRRFRFLMVGGPGGCPPW